MTSRNKKNLAVLSCFFALLAIICFLPLPVKAEGASLYLSPNSGTFYTGNTFNVSIFLNTGGNNVNAAEVDLKFNPQKMQIVNQAAGKSFISIWAAPPMYSNSEGTIVFQGGVPSPGINTSSGLVSTITFRAASPGETSVYFLKSSKILLDDGKGTDILNSSGKGQFTINVLPPEGPKVYSSTHPDMNKWYKNNNPAFSWEKEKGATEFSYSLDFDSGGTPDNVAEGKNTAVSYSELKDGHWYFHIKAKKEDIWGGTSHYAALIDTAPPAPFTPEVLPSSVTAESQVVIFFMAADTLSGIDHYEVKLIDITPGKKMSNEGFFTEASSPYKLSSLETGKYMVAVRVFDKAGNWRDETVKIEIIPQGIAARQDGLWLNGYYLSWWVIVLTITVLILMIILYYIYRWEKNKQDRKRELERLRTKKNELDEHIKRLENQ